MLYESDFWSFILVLHHRIYSLKTGRGAGGWGIARGRGGLEPANQKPSPPSTLEPPTSEMTLSTWVYGKPPFWIPVTQPPSWNPIGDVANWKRHQRVDEILIFFFFYLHYIREITKVVFKKKKNSVMQYACETYCNPVCAAYACLL